MNIYVGNLALDMTKDELQQEFIAFGQVISVSIMNDKYIGSGQPRGYGFVEMASQSEGKAAITSLKGKTIRGRVIDVIEALPLSDNSDAGPSHSRKASRFSGKRRQKRHIASCFTKKL
jgi:RNA recognition motif-containing protein